MWRFSRKQLTDESFWVIVISESETDNMKAYGMKRHDMLTCLFGCCSYHKNPLGRKHRKALVKRGKKAARQADRILCQNTSE
jgi:hypothetical protein